MSRLVKRLLLLVSTLGLGALAYALMRAEGERALRPRSREPEGSEPGPRPVSPEAAAPRRCAAVTRRGRRCTREAEPGSAYCWQHA